MPGIATQAASGVSENDDCKHTAKNRGTLIVGFVATINMLLCLLLLWFAWQLGATSATKEQQSLLDLMTQAEALGLEGTEIDRASQILGKIWDKEKEQIELDKQAESKRNEKARAAREKKMPAAAPKRRVSQTVMANASVRKKRTVKGKRRSQFESLTDYELRMARLEAFYNQTLEIDIIRHDKGCRDQSPWAVKMSLLQKAGQRKAANPFTKTNYTTR
jgi:hypothetical protein